MFCFDGRQMVKTKTINYLAHKRHLMRFVASVWASKCASGKGLNCGARKRSLIINPLDEREV